MKTTKNFASEKELINQINEFKNIINSSIGVEKDLFSKLLISAENDLKSGNFNN